MVDEEYVELEFNSSDYNSFYYTNDKQIRRMDDKFILSKIIEKYPDFSDKSCENLLKQVFMIIAKDSRLINGITKKYDISIKELFGIIYRNYSFLFNPCYVAKIQKLVKKSSYAKASKTVGRKNPIRARKSVRKRKSKKRKARAVKTL
jgi:hypothetical protein